MNKHEIIHRVYDHLTTQKEKCVEDTNCVYRSTSKKDGRPIACAIGALIDDKHWRRKWNKRGTAHDPVREALKKSGIDIPDFLGFDIHDLHDSKFIADLQVIHDSIIPDKWERELLKLADKYIVFV